MKYSILLSLTLIYCSTNSFSQTNASAIQLIKKTIIGGDGGWDYVSVSEEDRRIYISHATQVEVYNIDTHTKIGVIENTKGVHGICAIPSIGKGYTTNGKANTVSVFDIKTLKTIIELPVGDGPDALLYDEYSKQIFIFNNEGKTVSVIDIKTDKLVKTFEVGGSPEAGVTNDKGLIYVNLEDTNEIVVIEAKTLVVVKRFSLAPGSTPTGMAYSKKTNHLFSTCRKNSLMMVVDADNGTIITQLPIGKGVDGAVFDATSSLAIASNSEGTFTVIKEISKNSYVVLDTIKTEPRARTIAIDNKTKHLFTVTAQFGETPAATKENPRPRAAILSNTFMLLEYGIK